MLGVFTVSTSRSGQYLCEVFYLQGTEEDAARYVWWIAGKKYAMPIVGKDALTDAVKVSLGGTPVNLKSQDTTA